MMKLKLTIGGKEIELSVDEVKELHQELEKLLGMRETIVLPYPVVVPQVAPILIDDTGHRHWETPFTCHSLQ